jgi:hypothetical protein
MRLMREYIQLTMLIAVFFKSYFLQLKSICTLLKKSRRYASNSVTLFRYFLVNFKMIFEGIIQSFMFQVFASSTLICIEQFQIVLHNNLTISWWHSDMYWTIPIVLHNNLIINWHTDFEKNSECRRTICKQS